MQTVLMTTSQSKGNYLSKILIETKGRKKHKLEVSIDGLKILQMEHRFKARRDAHLLEKLEAAKDDLNYWFANTYPEITLKVHLVLSRKFEELEVRKTLKYYGNNQIIALTDVVDSHTWYNPYLMEKYVESFVEIHKSAIEAIVKNYQNYR